MTVTETNHSYRERKLSYLCNSNKNDDIYDYAHENLSLFDCLVIKDNKFCSLYVIKFHDLLLINEI